VSQSKTLDFRKSLLSETTESLICLMRVESDHIKLPVDQDSLSLLYAIDLKDPIECLFYSSTFSKLERAILEYPSETQAKLKSSFIYRIIQSNFVSE
jgi:hypothetical protein